MDRTVWHELWRVLHKIGALPLHVTGEKRPLGVENQQNIRHLFRRVPSSLNLTKKQPRPVQDPSSPSQRCRLLFGPLCHPVLPKPLERTQILLLTLRIGPLRPIPFFWSRSKEPKYYYQLYVRRSLIKTELASNRAHINSLSISQT